MPHDGLDTAGLTRAEAARRRASDGANTLPVDGRADILRQLWTIVSEPMLLLVLTAGVVNFLLAEPLDGSILMSTMVMIIGLSLHQQRKTATALGALREVSAPWATVVRDGATVRVPGADVVRGDLIVLVEGDRVPADALIIESENVRADESTLTGESVAVSKVPAGSSPSVDSPPGGDGRPHLFSGTLIVKGHCRAVVTATGARTSLGRIGVSLGSIRTVRTPLQRETDRIVRVVAVIGGAAAVFVAGAFALLRGGVLEGILAGIATAMAVLPEEYPVILSVFLALGAWRLSHDRVLARRPEAIETLGSMTVLCVDKTGTLTDPVGALDFRGRPEAIGRLVALVEASNHALARAVRPLRDRVTVPPAALPTNVVVTPGAGVSGRFGDLGADAGSRAWIASRHPLPAELTAWCDRAAEGGATLIIHAEAGTVVAAVSVRPTLRSTARDAVDRLRRYSVDCEIASGDRPEATAALAHELGIPAAGALLPQDKQERLARARREGRVTLMVGDGINDAPALHAADVSIAMGSGTALARAEAQVEIAGDDLTAIPLLIEAGKALRRVVRGNLAWTFAYNAAALALAVTGNLHPIAAALAMVLSSLVVGFRSARLLRFGAENHR